MKTRNYTNLELIEQMPDDANIITETEEGLKRVPANTVGKVKTVNGNEPDKDGNIEVQIPQGFSGSWNDLKDKPFYEETKEVFYFEETTVSDFEALDDFYNKFYDDGLSLKNTVNIGDKYIVTWDGVDYETVLNEEEGGAYLGFNPYGYVTEGFPFGFWLNPWDNKISMVCSETGGSHTFSIRGVKKVIKKLDTKYYTTVFYADYYSKLCKDKGLTQQVTAEEIVDASKNSLPILNRVVDNATQIAPLTVLYESPDNVEVLFGYEYSYSIYK